MYHRNSVNAKEEKQEPQSKRILFDIFKTTFRNGLLDLGHCSMAEAPL